MKNLLHLLCFLLSFTCYAQSQLEVGGILMPAASNFVGAAQREYIFPLNYGLRVNLQREKWLFSTGVLHITQGTRMEIEKTSSANPEGSGEFFNLYLRARMLAVPLNAYYTFASAGPVDFFGGLGVYLGYIYSQQEENTSIPENYQPDPQVSYPFPQQRFSDIDIFKRWYFGANAAVGARYSFNDRFVAELKPDFLYQLRQSAEQQRNTIRLMSFSASLGFYYLF